ncbi:hypothetical protein [Pseudomonas gingeri]|uniref:hypothetical protein n=1 Tax=Pseudomonas gingeri TaxID=117681 RepID=UPI0015BE3392|nr:hypothetical protein [Pseudomonas gingeri]NWD48409.1 hypothetical protein [Pseudomonas gingeri]
MSILAAIRQLIQCIGAASTNLQDASPVNSEVVNNMNQAAGRKPGQFRAGRLGSAFAPFG